MQSTNETQTSAPTHAEMKPPTFSLLSKEQAHHILTGHKAGVKYHPVIITQALIATGDLTMGREYES
jgi:hypothetical protein